MSQKNLCNDLIFGNWMDGSPVFSNKWDIPDLVKCSNSTEDCGWRASLGRLQTEFYSHSLQIKTTDTYLWSRDNQGTFCVTIIQADLVRKGTVSRWYPNDWDVVEAGGVRHAGRGELPVLRLAHDDGVHLLPDELVAHHDGCLDRVRVHYLSGVIQADILGQIKLLVVDLLQNFELMWNLG